jgi:hypothetical protein
MSDYVFRVSSARADEAVLDHRRKPRPEVGAARVLMPRAHTYLLGHGDAADSLPELRTAIEAEGRVKLSDVEAEWLRLVRHGVRSLSGELLDEHVWASLDEVFFEGRFAVAPAEHGTKLDELSHFLLASYCRSMGGNLQASAASEKTKLWRATLSRRQIPFGAADPIDAIRLTNPEPVV